MIWDIRRFILLKFRFRYEFWFGVEVLVGAVGDDNSFDFVKVFSVFFCFLSYVLEGEVFRFGDILLSWVNVKCGRVGR